MRAKGMIEGLESRRMFSADPVRVINGDGTPIDISQSTVIRYGEKVGLIVLGKNAAGLPARRIGTFDLPSVKSDGSTRVSGSDEGDVITAESTTGVHEVLDENGRDADGEADFINMIDPTTGERRIANRSDFANIGGQIKSYSSVAEGTEHELADARAANRTEDLESLQAELDSYHAKIAELRVLEDLVDNGRFIHYTLAGVYDCYVQIADDQSSAARVTVDAGEGNDTVSISSNVPMKSTLRGDSGADVLTSGKRSTLIYGGGGKDRLINRSTKGGTLDGGQGADRYFNKTTSDVQIVGRNDGDQMIAGEGSVPITRVVMVSQALGRDGYWSVREVRHNEDGSVSLELLELVKPTA